MSDQYERLMKAVFDYAEARRYGDTQATHRESAPYRAVEREARILEASAKEDAMQALLMRLRERELTEGEPWFTENMVGLVELARNTTVRDHQALIQQREEG